MHAQQANNFLIKGLLSTDSLFDRLLFAMEIRIAYRNNLIGYISKLLHGTQLDTSLQEYSHCIYYEQRI